MSFNFNSEIVMAQSLRADDFALGQVFRTSEATFGTRIIRTVYFSLGPVFEVSTLGSNAASFLIYRTKAGVRVDNPGDPEWPEGPAAMSMEEAFALVSEETRHERAVAAATRAGWSVVPIRHR